MQKTDNYDDVLLLGIPINNLDFRESVSRIIAMTEEFKVDQRSRYVATVNVDFMVNTLAWNDDAHRHPELLNTLRNADMVTADGMPIVWSSRLLGSSLRDRVTGADLVPGLAEQAAEKRKSIYFLGGREGIAKKAAGILKAQFPSLSIAGTSSPFVHVTGEELGDAMDNDEQIIRDINNSGADILLIAFGNPKQEIWYNRNRNRLKIPVTLGIGGTFEFIASTVKRAPIWMRKSGVEWIYRITQDPKRLWKRYLVGFFKIICMVLPVVLDNYLRKMRFKILGIKNNAPCDSLEFQAHDGLINIIRLQSNCNNGTFNQIEGAISNLSECKAIVLDFSAVHYVDPVALSYFVSLLKKIDRSGIRSYVMGGQRTGERLHDHQSHLGLLL